MEVQLLSSAPTFEMKRAVLILLLLALRATGATLPVTEGKSLQLPTLNYDNLPQPTRTEPVSPVSSQRRPAGKTIENKTINTDTLQYGTLSFKMLPQTNFTAKRAAVAGPRPAETVSTPRAVIERRVIRAVTPEGAEELKKQLNEPH